MCEIESWCWQIAAKFHARVDSLARISSFDAIFIGHGAFGMNLFILVATKNSHREDENRSVNKRYVGLKTDNVMVKTGTLPEIRELNFENLLVATKKLIV